MDVPLDLEAICKQVVSLMVGTFDFPEAEARDRINLWKRFLQPMAGQYAFWERLEDYARSPACHRL